AEAVRLLRAVARFGTTTEDASPRERDRPKQRSTITTVRRETRMEAAAWSHGRPTRAHSWPAPGFWRTRPQALVPRSARPSWRAPWVEPNRSSLRPARIDTE